MASGRGTWPANILSNFQNTIDASDRIRWHEGSVDASEGFMEEPITRWETSVFNRWCYKIPQTLTYKFLPPGTREGYVT